jgi:hypothetical protein
MVLVEELLDAAFEEEAWCLGIAGRGVVLLI